MFFDSFRAPIGSSATRASSVASTMTRSTRSGGSWNGNYSQWLPQRLERATGLIVLDVSTPISLVRYVRRTLLERDRRGGLDGVTDRLDPGMVRWIVTQTPGNRARYREQVSSAGIPAILLSSRHALRRFYIAGGLRR